MAREVTYDYYSEVCEREEKKPCESIFFFPDNIHAALTVYSVPPVKGQKVYFRNTDLSIHAPESAKYNFAPSQTVEVNGTRKVIFRLFETNLFKVKEVYQSVSVQMFDVNGKSLACPSVHYQVILGRVVDWFAIKGLVRRNIVALKKKIVDFLLRRQKAKKNRKLLVEAASKQMNPINKEQYKI